MTTYTLDRNATQKATPITTPDAPVKPRLLDQVRAAIRTRNYSLSTEKTADD